MTDIAVQQQNDTLLFTNAQ